MQNESCLAAIGRVCSWHLYALLVADGEMREGKTETKGWLNLEDVPPHNNDVHRKNLRVSALSMRGSIPRVSPMCHPALRAASHASGREDLYGLPKAAVFVISGEDRDYLPSAAAGSSSYATRRVMDGAVLPRKAESPSRPWSPSATPLTSSASSVNSMS